MQVSLLLRRAETRKGCKQVSVLSQVLVFLMQINLLVGRAVTRNWCKQVSVLSQVLVF